MKPEIEPALLRELVQYDPETGLFKWKARKQKHIRGRQAVGIWNTQWAGKPAFATPTDGGYLRGSLFNVDYKAHRVAWAIFYGEWPTDEIDHINRRKTDNRISNLRVVDRVANANNRVVSSVRSGLNGIDAERGRWRVRIRVNGKRTYVGSYLCLAEAIKAKQEFLSQL